MASLGRAPLLNEIEVKQAIEKFLSGLA